MPDQPSQPSQPDQPESQNQPQPAAEPSEPVSREALEHARRQAAEARMRARELEDENKRIQQRMQATEDAGKSDAEKEKARADRLEKRLATMEQQQARHEVAADKKLPVELLEHMSGADRTALEQAADRIVAYAKSVADAAVETSGRPRRSADPIARGTPVSEPLDMNEYIRTGFRR